MKCNKCLVEKGIAGQGFTKYTCSYCDKEFWHHNTNVPKYCPECAKRLGACEQCGELLPDIERHSCIECKYYDFEEDWEGDCYFYCYKNHEDVYNVWEYEFVCEDFEKDN